MFWHFNTIENFASSSELKFMKAQLIFYVLLGLNSREEAFDIVLFVHPDSVQHIPSDCSGKLVTSLTLVTLPTLCKIWSRNKKSLKLYITRRTEVKMFS